MGNERKIIASVYNILHYYDEEKPAPSYLKVVGHFSNYEKAQNGFCEQLSPIIASYCQTQLTMSYNLYVAHGSLSVEQLRKDPSFLITSNILKPALDDNKYKHIASYDILVKFFILTYLICPFEVMKNQATSEFLKHLIGSNLAIFSFKGDVIIPLIEFEQYIKNNNKLSKLKSFISDGSTQMALQFSKAATQHSAKRDYLNFKLEQNLQVILDKPQALSPKLPVK